MLNWIKSYSLKMWYNKFKNKEVNLLRKTVIKLIGTVIHDWFTTSWFCYNVYTLTVRYSLEIFFFIDNTVYWAQSYCLKVGYNKFEIKK